MSNKKKVRKDAIKSDGTVVTIKPDTKSGRASGNRREKLMNENGYKTERIHYDPISPDYQPNSPTYIGPKSK